MRSTFRTRPASWRGPVLGVVSAVLVSALATACSSGTSSNAGSAKSGFAGQSITYLYFTNGPDLGATKTLISEFEAQTGATVTLDTVPYANLNETIQAQVSAGKPPAVVQTSAPGIFAPDLINLGQALGQSWVNTLNPNLLEGGEYKGEVIGLPNQLTVMGPMVNVNMFQKAGVPVPTINSSWTWPQLVADAEKVQAANHTPFAIAIDHSGDRVANVFAQYGTYLFGSNGNSTWNTQDATNAMKEFSGLIASNEISKASWIAGGENFVAGDTEFLAEQTPVLLSGSWEVASFATNVPFKWTAVPNPCGVNCGGGSGGNYMVAFKNSNDPKLAEAFIKFMSEPANQAYMSKISDTVPSSESLAAPGSITYSSTIASSMDVFNKAATLMPGAYTLSESNPGYTAASLALMNEVTDVVAGKATVAQAVTAVTAAATANDGKS
jgi:alpha-1,4-digalacturonate transport system substrate-binding protein